MTRSTSAFLVALGLVASACDASPDRGVAEEPRERRPLASPTHPDTRVIGLVGTMRDALGRRGEDIFEGADVGVSVLNRRLEGERIFELVSLDDRGDPARATELVQGLAESERTVGVIYAGPPEGLPPAGAALAGAGIPGVLVFGDLYSARLLREPLFQVSPPLLWQARRLAAYLKQDRGYETIGLLAERSLGGRTAIRSLRAAVRELPGAPRRVTVATYPEGESEFRPYLDRLRQARVEALVFQGGAMPFSEVMATLEDMGASYRNTRAARIRSAPQNLRVARVRGGHWRPQPAAFDPAVSPSVQAELPAGTAAAETYARGAHYLPVPSFEQFRDAFEDWWGSVPTGWQLRGYEAARMIGWAASRAGRDETVIEALEKAENLRFGGLDVSFGPDDRTAVEVSSVGLWVVPREDVRVPERDRIPERLPWVPLARGFTLRGPRTNIADRDWRHLFRDPPPRNAPAPPFRRMRFGVTTPATDPVH